MARTRHIVGWTVTLAAALGVGAPAYADVILAPDGTRMPIDRHRALIVHQGTSEVVVETLSVQVNVRRSLWIKPLPTEPRY